MSSSPTRDQLTTVLDMLASRLATLELTMQNFGSTHPPPAVHIGHTNVPDDFYKPSNKKKGKGKAAPPPPKHQPNCPQNSSSTPAAKAKGKQTTLSAAMRTAPTVTAFSSLHLRSMLGKEFVRGRSYELSMWYST